MPELHVTTLVALLGFVAGIVFGATAQRTSFCTMGAISDMIAMQDYRRFRAWLLAIAVAIAGSQALQLIGAVDLGRSIYLASSLGWLGAIVGGLMFGFGMTLAGGCGNRTLVRLGSGNLKSLVVVLVLGVFAYMTLRGIIGLGRIAVIEPTNVNIGMQGLPDLLARATGFGASATRALLALAVTAGLLWICFKDPAFRTSARDVIAGAVIGLLIPVGWIITGIAGADDFDPTALASFTFVAPIGESLMYLMTFSGATINFGIASVGGVIVGAFAMATATRRFRIEAFTGGADMLRHIVGGALMGTGGVLSLGCTIGQGITGLSTLGVGSLIAFLAVVAGGIAGITYLEEGSLGGAARRFWLGRA